MFYILVWLDVFCSVKFFRAMLVGVVLILGMIPTIQATTDCSCDFEEKYIDEDGNYIRDENGNYIREYCRGEFTNMLENECKTLVTLYKKTNGYHWKYNSEEWSRNYSPCHWYGVRCFNYNDGHVTGLNLEDNRLKGSIPNFNNLHGLEYFNLSNNQITGSVPNFNNLSNLERIILSDNRLSGSIPKFNHLPNLEVISLENNRLRSSIPNFKFLPSLKVIDLSNNLLSGSVPNFNHLPNLRFIGLENNKLRSFIPNFNYLPSLNSLSLSNNQLSGSVPDSFSNLPNLKNLWLYNNQLTGTISDFSSLSNLENLFLSDNQLTGSIPNFSKLLNLKNLGLWGSQLSGSIPNFSHLPKLEELILRDNRLTDSIPDFRKLPNLKELFLQNNQLSGFIPNFNNLPNLNWLWLDNNQLNGSIPNFSNLPNLEFLLLSNNQLSGSIPNFNNLPSLKTLGLSNNQLSGPIPDFSHLSNLNSLYLYRNKQLCRKPNVDYSRWASAMQYSLCSSTLTIHGIHKKRSAGHFYVELIERDENTGETTEQLIYGKYPKEGYFIKNLKLGIFLSDNPSLGGIMKFYPDGIIKDDSQKHQKALNAPNIYNLKSTEEFYITQEQYEKAKRVINYHRKSKILSYNWDDNNCIDFAQEIYKTTGQNGHFTQHFTAKEKAQLGLAGIQTILRFSNTRSTRKGSKQKYIPVSAQQFSKILNMSVAEMYQHNEFLQERVFYPEQFSEEIWLLESGIDKLNITPKASNILGINSPITNYEWAINGQSLSSSAEIKLADTKNNTITLTLGNNQGQTTSIKENITIPNSNSGTMFRINTQADIYPKPLQPVAGFSIKGNGMQTVMFRGISHNVDTIITILEYPSRKIVASNDNWQDDIRIKEVPQHLHLPKTTNSGAIVDLPTGAYTIAINSHNKIGRGAIVIDLLSKSAQITRFNTIASTGHADVVGFITRGNSRKVLFLGMELNNFDPTIKVEKHIGREFLNSNANWKDAIGITKPLPKLKDAALLLDLPADAYIATISDNDGNKAGRGIFSIQVIE